MLTLLITLDCVRDDHVGGELTPSLGALAPEWTHFTQAFAQSQNTLSSHLSMLTSNYLFQHGVYSNFEQKALPAHALPRRLQERGWACAALTSIDFLALLLGNQVGEPDPRFPPLADRSLRARAARRWYGRRHAAGKTLARALGWVKASRARDAFLWVHLFDAHMVYEAPAPYLGRRVTARKTDASVKAQLGEKGWFSPDFPEYEWHVPLEHFPQRYGAAVSYLDACLGDFFSALKGAGCWEDALVMVTADHGECLLGDHSVYCAHKKLFDTTVKVPLRVKFPGGRFAGERVDALVQHVDLAPTAAAAAGTGDPMYMGRDLGAVAGGKDPGHAVVFSEHVDNFMRAVRDREFIYAEPVPGSENRWGMAMEEQTLFRRDGSPAPAGFGGHAERLKAALDAVLASGAGASAQWGGAKDADAEVAERLKSLGYL